MPLLQKRNPHATPDSVIKSSLGGVALGMGVILFQWLVGRLPVTFMWFAVPLMAIAGAIIGAAAEWQWPSDDSDEDRALEDGTKDQGISNYDATSNRTNVI